MFGARDADPDYVEDVPRAGKWLNYRGAGEAATFRQALDLVTHADITWDPYTEHRPIRPLELISFYRGFIRFSGLMLPYLPDQVMRQFGYVQGIPADPRSIRQQPVSPADMDLMWRDFDRHVIVTGPRAVDPSDTVPGYMSWFMTVSHPFIYPQNYQIDVCF